MCPTPYPHRQCQHTTAFISQPPPPLAPRNVTHLDPLQTKPNHTFLSLPQQLHGPPPVLGQHPSNLPPPPLAPPASHGAIAGRVTRRRRFPVLQHARERSAEYVTHLRLVLVTTTGGEAGEKQGGRKD